MTTAYHVPLTDGLVASQAVLTDAGKKLVSVDYLDQSVKTTASPTFSGLALNPVTLGASQLKIQNNSTGCFSTLAYGPDNNSFGFDVYWSGTGWIATDTSCFWLYKVMDTLRLQFDNGRTVGGAASVRPALIIHGVDTGVFVAGDAECVYSLHAATVRANTAFNLNGAAGVTQAGVNNIFMATHTLNFTGGILTSVT
jgi:hypothetical protein